MRGQMPPQPVPPPGVRGINPALQGRPGMPGKTL